MNEVLTAVYEKGVLRPLSPLNLHERQMVRIQVVPEELAPADELEEIIRSLIVAGLLSARPSRVAPPADPVSAEERRRLAEVLGSAPGKPLSEIVIEERGEW